MTDSVIQRTLARLSGRSAHVSDLSANREPADSIKMRHLVETEIFASMSDAEKHWLMTNTSMVTCERGRVFYAPDEPGEVMFILKRGKVNLYRLSPDGRKLVVSSLGPHSIFGQMGIIGQGMYGCFAEASEECLICVLSANDLQTLIHRNPQVGIDLLSEMSRRLQERESDLERFAFAGVPSRLAELLIREADDQGTISGLTHQDLAERIGTYRETVSQVLGKFKSDGLVEISPRRITITNRDAMNALIPE